MNFIFLPDRGVYRINITISGFTAKVLKKLTGVQFKKKKKTHRKRSKTSQYKRFQGQVYHIWGHRCIKCGATKNLSIHHMLSYSRYPHFRLDPDLSMPLCLDCHCKFHELYPNDYNLETLYQWIWGTP